MTISLFIGRFQPFHKAHLSDIRLALKKSSKVIIAIGSSSESGTRDNPFSYEERKEMIKQALCKHNIGDYDIVPVPDINDNDRWVDHVRKIIPDFDVVYTGNSLTEKLFCDKNVKVVKVDLIPGINATEIRKRIVESKEWKELVPVEVFEYIEKIDGIRGACSQIR
ncbi:MAG: nicotinamide-nucleotide adenylyltransferase [Nanoarchaeota archaeon]